MVKVKFLAVQIQLLTKLLMSVKITQSPNLLAEKKHVLSSLLRSPWGASALISLDAFSDSLTSGSWGWALDTFGPWQLWGWYQSKTMENADCKRPAGWISMSKQAPERAKKLGTSWSGDQVKDFSWNLWHRCSHQNRPPSVPSGHLQLVLQRPLVHHRLGHLPVHPAWAFQPAAGPGNWNHFFWYCTLYTWRKRGNWFLLISSMSIEPATTRPSMSPPHPLRQPSPMAIAAGRSLRSADFGSFDMMLSPFRGHVNPGPINPWAVTNTERERYIYVCVKIYIYIYTVSGSFKAAYNFWNRLIMSSNLESIQGSSIRGWDYLIIQCWFTSHGLCG